MFAARPRAGAGLTPSSLVTAPSGCATMREERVDGQLLGRHGVDDAAVLHDHDPVADPQDLLELGRDEHDRQPVVGELADQVLHLDLRADVDAPGRLVEHAARGGRAPAAGRAAPSAGCRRRGCPPAGPTSGGRMSSASIQLSASSRCRDGRIRRRMPRSACSASVMFSCTLSSPMIPSARRFSEE